MFTICGELSKVDTEEASGYRMLESSMLVISKCETKRQLADIFGLELGLDHLMLCSEKAVLLFRDVGIVCMLITTWCHWCLLPTDDSCSQLNDKRPQ